MTSIDSLRQRLDERTAPISREDFQDAHIVNDIRLGCIAGAPITPAQKLEQVTENQLDSINATGILLDTKSSKEATKLIEGVQRVLFHIYDPQQAEQYLDRCVTYASAYHEKGVPEGAPLGGPWMITILNDIGHLHDFRTTIHAYRNNLSTGSEDESVRQILRQPVIARVPELDAILTPEAKALTILRDVRGFVFQKTRDLQTFQEQWKDVPLLEKHIGDVSHIQPHIFFEGSHSAIRKFHEGGNSCDGYIAKNGLNEKRASHIYNARINQITKQASPPPFHTAQSNTIHVGVVALQGAYHLEREVVDSLQGSVFGYNIETALIETRQQMRNLDLVVLGGGWHGVQLKLYSDPRLDIIEGVRSHMERGKAVFLSCAGAILGRNPNKPAEGCSTWEPAGFFDGTVRNNCINGTQTVRVRKNGEWDDAIEVRGRFSAAPIFEQLGDNVQPFAKLEDDRIVGIEEKFPQRKNAYVVAAAFHNRVATHRVLKAIAQQRGEQAEITD